MTFTETKWEGVIRILTKDDFAKAFVRWLDRCKNIFESAAAMLRSLRKYIFS
jgi:hypothetical protein